MKKIVQPRYPEESWYPAQDRIYAIINLIFKFDEKIKDLTRNTFRRRQGNQESTQIVTTQEWIINKSQTKQDYKVTKNWPKYLKIEHQ